MILTTILLSLVGAVIAAVVGTFWYSNATPMGKIQLRYMEFDKLSPEEQKAKMAEGKSMMWKMYGSQLVLSFLMAFWVVFVLSESVQNGLPLLMAVSFPVFSWISFVVPTIGTGILWSNCDRSIAWQKFFSDVFYNLVTILLIAFVTSFFV